MGKCKDFLKVSLRYRNTIAFVLTPLVFLPLPLVVQSPEAKCAYAMIIMAVFWCAEVLPLAVTGLMPVFLFPMMGLLTTKAVCYNYLKDSTMMFTGGLLVAIAIENCDLHRRLALGVLTLVGAKPRWLMFGFMAPTWLLSMWISNTATTAMMIPVAEAVMNQLEDHRKKLRNENAEQQDEETSIANGVTFTLDQGQTKVNGTINEGYEPDSKSTDLPADHSDIAIQTQTSKVDLQTSKTLSRIDSYTQSADVMDMVDDNRKSYNISHNPGGEKGVTSVVDDDADEARFNHMCKGMTLCVAYAANVGGTATLTGTGPNIIMKGAVDEVFEAHGMKSPLTFSSWMIFGLPTAFILLFIVWLWMIFYHLGWRSWACCLDVKDPEHNKVVTRCIKEEYKKLGKITFSQIVVGLLFLCLVLLWFFRDPEFMPGWAKAFKSGYVGDAVPAILIAVIMFAIPNKLPCAANLTAAEKKKPNYLLDWQSVSKKFPWSVIFLMGGGFALAEACTTSGLSKFIGDGLTGLKVLPDWLMVMILCLLVAMLTEVTSNSATCSILMPIMAAMAESIGKNPLYLMFPVAISTSFAFMLPVATPPNAIAFTYGRIRVIDMIKAGAILNVLCVLVVTLATHTWGMAYFRFDVLPWGNQNVTMTTMASIATT